MSNWYCWHYAHSLQGLFCMPAVPCATGSLAWEGLRGSLGRTESDKASRTAVGVHDCVPLDAHLLGMFQMTGHLRVFYVSHSCFRSAPLPVIAGVRRVAWLCSVFSGPTGPNFLTICNTSGISILYSI